MKIQCFSCRSLEHIHKNVVPLPAYSTLTLRNKFASTHFTPGIVKLALVYLNKIIPPMSEKNQLCSILFDEVKTNNHDEVDQK